MKQVQATKTAKPTPRGWGSHRTLQMLDPELQDLGGSARPNLPVTIVLLVHTGNAHFVIITGSLSHSFLYCLGPQKTFSTPRDQVHGLDGNRLYYWAIFQLCGLQNRVRSC